MGRSIEDQIKAAFVSLAKMLGQYGEPAAARVENARMSQTRLKALEKSDADKIVASNPRRSIVGLAAQSDGSAVSHINSMANMSHYRLAAYASTLPPSRMEQKIEDVLEDHEFIDTKERRALELAAKYC